MHVPDKRKFDIIYSVCLYLSRPRQQKSHRKRRAVSTVVLLLISDKGNLRVQTVETVISDIISPAFLLSCSRLCLHNTTVVLTGTCDDSVADYSTLQSTLYEKRNANCT